MTAAELLSVAAFAEGRCAQAFPSFGSVPVLRQPSGRAPVRRSLVPDHSDV